MFKYKLLIEKKTSMKIRNLLLAVLVVMGYQSFGQNGGNPNDVLGQKQKGANVITTSVPFVSIAPDARGGAMGDCGAATEADVYSMHYNPAKYTFLDQKLSIGLGYSPWLNNLVKDMHLAYLAGAYKIDDKSAVAGSLRYFSCGEIHFTDSDGNPAGNYEPNEWAIDATYSRLLGDYLSGAVAGRFIYSDLTQGQSQTGDASAGWSVAADVAVYYKRPVEWFSNMDAEFAFGGAISNIGSKVSYRNAGIKKDFIPTMLRFGPNLKMELDEYNSLAFSVDFTKLLVPTPPIYGKDSITHQQVIQHGMDNDVSTIVGMIHSFYDAPGGFSEEVREINIGVGAEYWYNNVFAVRAGYFNEPRMKGNRKYATLGAALKYNMFLLDVSYLVPVNVKNGTSPLENTLRFNLSWLFGK